MAVVLIVQKAKIRYSWGFIPLKILKQGTVGDLFHWKDQNKVRLDFLYAAVVFRS